MKSICNDLAAEQASLDDMIKDLDDDEWLVKTPFFDWTIKDEISHLAYFDMAARLSATDRKEFAAGFEKLVAGVSDFNDIFGQVNAIGNAMTNPELLAWWRKEREQLLEAFAGPPETGPEPGARKNIA